MSVVVDADKFSQEIEAEELGVILANVAGDFRDDTPAFAAFIQKACDHARNHHRLDHSTDEADEILGAFERIAAKYM